jgi:hypothetical protein
MNEIMSASGRYREPVGSWKADKSDRYTAGRQACRLSSGRQDFSFPTKTITKQKTNFITSTLKASALLFQTYKHILRTIT